MTNAAKLLRLYRAEYGFSVRDMAPRIGVSAATLNRIERGHGMDATSLVKVITWLMSEK
jgi:DNA-binding XRE family transcriptional regulator